MAVVTAAVVGAASAVAGTVSNISRSAKAAKEAKRARQAIQSYERQDLANIYDTAQISTLGSDLQREEAARTAATQIDALRQAGTRGLIGGLGRVGMQSNLVSRQIGADLDRQQQELEMLRAQDEARIRAIQEQREVGELAGLGQQYQTGRQEQAQGLSQAIGGLASIGGAIGGFAGLGGAAGRATSAVAPGAAGIPQIPSLATNPYTY